jgi:hypothetical protein
MNDYVSRSDLTQVDRVAARAPSAVLPVQPVAARQGRGTQAGQPQDGGPNPSLSEDDLASAAEYAKVRARVADILANLRSASATATVEAAEAEIQTLLPAPMILVPLPPASKEAIESAVKLGERIAEQASYALAAQSHLKRGTVDQLLSTDQ